MLLYKQKKNQKGNRFLISVTVLGSSGPIRFVVNEDELVAGIINTALKTYGREGRLPLLVSDFNSFSLYCPGAGADALNPWETIGSTEFRNFVLYKKPPTEQVEDVGRRPSPRTLRKGSNVSCTTWFNKFLNPKITSH